MTANSYEHKMIFVKEVVDPNGGAVGLELTAVAVDLNPDKAPTMRELGTEEIDDDMNQYILSVQESVFKVYGLLVSQIIEECNKNNGPIPHFGYVDMVERLQQAPHLLLANVLASIVTNQAGKQYSEQHLPVTGR